MRSELNIAIIGAGLCGLSAAIRAADIGAKVEVFEAASAVGGMARTHIYGQYKFDVGPHSFYPRRLELAQFFHELLPGQVRESITRGAIYRDNRTYNYPWSVIDFISKNPAGTSAHFLLSYIGARALLPIKRRLPNRNFETWCRLRFGRKFYEYFLHDHLTKSYGIEPKFLPWIWAAQRIHVPTLTKSIGDLLAARQRILHSYYPVNGIGALSIEMARKAISAGAIINTNCRATAISVRREGAVVRIIDKDNVTTDHNFDRVISTAPLTELLQCIAPSIPEATLKAASGLRYRAAIFAFFSASCESILDYELCYFPSPEENFIRLYEPNKYSSICTPPGYSSLCVEFHCDYGDALWRMSDESLARQTTAQLARVSGIRGVKSLSLLGIIRLPHHYPLPLVSDSEMVNIERCLTSLSPTIVSCGRLGSFRYINMDDAILMGRIAGDVACGRAEYVDIAAVADRNSSIETAGRA